MISLAIFLSFGLCVGVLARLLVAGRDDGGWIDSMMLGVGGAALGSVFAEMLGSYRPGNVVGFVMPLLCAVILVVAYHAFEQHRGVA